MYISTSVKDGRVYATASKSVRKGAKVGKSDSKYLGRVIDREKGIYKNKERGLFMYDEKTDTFSPVPADYQEPKLKRKKKYPDRPEHIVSFGDVYLLLQFLVQSGFMYAIDAIEYKNNDTLWSLLLYYILCPLSNRHAQDWWSLTYAKYLFPKAQLASQRISEALADIGSEDAKRKFFREYFHFLEKRKDDPQAMDEEANGGILIDSTGLPNAIRFPLTAVNNHNGKISEEIRLIYVIQQSTGLPIFFRYVAGNVIDASTITRTIAELKANGINTKFAILDAGYYNGKNADALMDAGVSFISRMDSNYKVYRRLIKNNLSSLDAKENLVRYNNRLLYIKCFPCHIGVKEDRHAYAYLCRDLTMKHELEKKLIERAEDQDLPTDEIFDTMQTQGVFVLISSRKIARNKILPLYYTRDRVEKIFELCKKDCKILPINVETEASFRGHLLLTFMATSILKMLSDKLEGTSLTTESAFMNLHEQHAIIYDDVIVTTEPTKKMNEAYRALRIECPETLTNEFKESKAM
jgi:hypothetical protein